MDVQTKRYWAMGGMGFALGAILSPVVLIGIFVLMRVSQESSYARFDQAVQTGDLAGFEGVIPRSEWGSEYEVVVQNAVYTIVVVPIPPSATMLASGPSMAIFDASGTLINQTRDSGDEVFEWELWRNHPRTLVSGQGAY